MDKVELGSMEDVNAPAKVRTKTVWRGNNQQGWMLNGNPMKGELYRAIPILIEFPTEKQFRAVVETIQGQQTMEQWKGLLPPSAADGVTIPRKYLDYLVDQRLREVELEMREAKAKPQEIRDEMGRVRGLIYEANGVTDAMIPEEIASRHASVNAAGKHPKGHPAGKTT